MTDLEHSDSPMTDSAQRFRILDGVRAAVDAASNGHPVTRVDGGQEPVWCIAGHDQHAAVRDLLKFDFHFADTTSFREHITAEMVRCPDWEAQLAAGSDAIGALLKAKKPLVAYAPPRTFFEAYAIAANVLRTALHSTPADTTSTTAQQRPLTDGASHADS